MASDLTLALVFVAACGAGGMPAVTPSVIAADDQSQPLRIGELAAVDYLTTTADRLVLAADYRATIGGVDTIIGSADASGVTVTLVQPLVVGDYPLDLVAGARTWHVDNALEVVPAVTSADGGLGDADAARDAAADASLDAAADAGVDAPPDAGVDALPDASVDAAVDAMPPCFGTGLVQVCPTVTPTGTLDLPDGQLDTDSSPLCAAFTSPNGTTGCLVAADAIVASGGNVVTAIGSRPLILLATATLTLSGNARIDVASHVGGVVGAGSAPSCTTGTLPSGVGGGYGASFGGRGGGGGASGGNSPSVPTITTFTGGCPGSDGAGPTRGAGGRGGGAVYMLAGTALTISGTVSVDASGASGRGGGNSTSGAGGGGSGGSIGLEAPMLTITGGARLFANGGGGGGGSSLTAGAAGTDSTSPTTAAIGGAGGSLLGGDGGAGSHGNTLNGSPGGGLLGGGGGGGGAAGVITLRATTLSVSVSPSPPAS